MSESLDVTISDIKTVDRRKPHYLRWRVGPKRHGKSFVTRAMADTYRARLMTAARNGEPFDTETGEPVSWKRESDGPAVTWYEHAVDYVIMKWPTVSPNSRTGIAEALTVLTMTLVADKANRPIDTALRKALYGWAFNLTARKTEPTPEAARTIRWVESASVPLNSLQNPVTARKALTALATLTDGTKARPSTFTRKRATFYNAIRYAIELDRLAANPLDRIQWRVPKKVETVDPRVVANPEQVRLMLAEVRKLRPRMVGFFACLYFAAMRPGEVLHLTASQCYLPEKGWGRLDLTTTATRAGRAWTDNGEVHDVRGLKHRATGEVRPVPIPPELVRILRAHLDEFGTAPDGRLFRGTRKDADGSPGYLSESTYGPIWKRARVRALERFGPTAAKLADRPYDLRHGGVSLWLASGVAAPEVARRAGHSVDVLLRVYAKVIDGQQDAANRRIDDALGEPNAEPECGPEDDSMDEG